MVKTIQAEAYRFKTTSGNYYIFDNVSGVVIPGSDELYYIVCNFNKLDKEQMIFKLNLNYNLNLIEGEIYYTHIKNLINQGCFYRKNLKFSADRIDQQKLSKTEMSQLILIVTESCNMRCNYCIYSNHYSYVKGYSNKGMSDDVAKRSIDFYMKLHKKRLEAGYMKQPEINFYGGEPLLKFKLLKEIVEYCKKNDFMPNYNITTNGTVMNEEIINFLVDNKFTVTFSLDGNKKEHDRNRVFKNGKGSFDLVFKNICRLQQKKQKINDEKPILFSCCYDLYTNMEDVINFFDEYNSLLEQRFILFNQIYRYDSTYYNYYDKIYKENSKLAHFNSLKNLQSTFNDNLLKNLQNTPALFYLFSKLNLTYNRPMGVYSSLCGSCTIGSKVAVDPDGNFYLCEKMGQTCSIGDVNNGIDFDKANDLQDKFLSIINKNCAECKVSRLCELCYAYVAKSDTIEFNYEFCKDRKSSIHHQLTTIFSILELNPNAFSDGSSNITAPVEIDTINDNKIGL